MHLVSYHFGKVFSETAVSPNSRHKTIFYSISINVFNTICLFSSSDRSETLEVSASAGVLSSPPLYTYSPALLLFAEYERVFGRLKRISTLPQCCLFDDVVEACE